MLTKIVVDGCKVLCSAASATELSEMYEEARRQADLRGSAPDRKPVDGLFFHYEMVGPIEVRYRDRAYILWGSPRELRFYTPEEFEVLREQ
jgi:hypothetical protein